MNLRARLFMLLDEYRRETEVEVSASLSTVRLCDIVMNTTSTKEVLADIVTEVVGLSTADRAQLFLLIRFLRDSTPETLEAPK